MRAVLLFAASGLVAAGCGGSEPDEGLPVSGEVSGTIAENQTWTDTIAIVGDTTIAAGVTVTVDPGTAITAVDGAGLHVEGTFDAAGTAEQPISFLPAAVAWNGIVADSGGSVHLAHAEGTAVATLLFCHAGARRCHLESVDFHDLHQAIAAEGTALVEGSRITGIDDAGVTVIGGDLTVRDSYVHTSEGDLIVAVNGNLLVEYSEIGDAAGTYQHCDIHVGAAASLTVTRTNFVNGDYGMMIGGTSGASITYNNWTGNTEDVSEVGINTDVDLTHNYWEAGAPSLGGAYDVSNPETSPILDAGPRI